MGTKCLCTDAEYSNQKHYIFLLIYIFYKITNSSSRWLDLPGLVVVTLDGVEVVMVLSTSSARRNISNFMPLTTLSLFPCVMRRIFYGYITNSQYDQLPVVVVSVDVLVDCFGKVINLCLSLTYPKYFEVDYD